MEQIQFNDKVNLIWQVAETLRGVYKPEKYGDVILPMCIIRRFDSILSSSKEEVISLYEAYKDLPEDSREEMMFISMKEELGISQRFYNTSPFTLKTLLNDSAFVKDHFNEYLNGFSSTVQDIITHFDFRKEIEKLQKNNALFNTIKEFVNIDFHPDVVSQQEMGYIFEELIRRFNEHGEAGDHYTPREVIWLCMDLLFHDREEMLTISEKFLSVADFCSGTGGMLSIAEKYIYQQNKDAHIELYGQEINDQSYAICKSDLLIKGQEPDNIVLGNTLMLDQLGHKERHFRFLISNPPFGVQWKKEESSVKDEHESYGFNGRFGAGTPRVSDGSLLFLQNMISKMFDDAEGSRIAIIFNGSPLFTGDAGSGESNIRKWIIESDLLEGIVALPTDLFYNTGIATYIWVLSNRKAPERQGKIQLVNGTTFFKPMRKSLGNKRKEITPDQIAQLKGIYEQFTPGEYCKIFNNEVFGYRKVTIERPLKLSFQVTPDKIEAIQAHKTFINLALSKKKDAAIKAAAEAAGKIEQQKLIDLLKSFSATERFNSREQFIQKLKQKIKQNKLTFIKAGLIKMIWQTIGERDETAEPCRDSKGNIEPDTSLRDSETIPLGEDVDAYVKREVLPHVPDAYIERSTIDKIGYEIPFTRHFYKYEQLRGFEEIMDEVKALEADIQRGIKGVFA